MDRCKFIYPCQSLSFRNNNINKDEPKKSIQEIFLKEISSKLDSLKCARSSIKNSNYCSKHVNTLQDRLSKKVILNVNGTNYIFKNLEAIAELDGLKTTKINPEHIYTLEKNGYKVYSLAKR